MGVGLYFLLVNFPSPPSYPITFSLQSPQICSDPLFINEMQDQAIFFLLENSTENSGSFNNVDLKLRYPLVFLIIMLIKRLKINIDQKN